MSGCEDEGPEPAGGSAGDGQDMPDSDGAASNGGVEAGSDGGVSSASDGGVGADLEALEAALREHGLFAWLDLEIESVEPGRVVFRLPFDAKFANLSSGTVHGGITATVIDTASGFALRSTFEEPETAQLTTTDLNVRYLRPARDDLRVDCEVVRAGESMGVTHCEVTTVHEGERTVVATGGTSYRLFREDT